MRIALFLFLVGTSVLYGQFYDPEPTLWSPIYNPSGEQAVPLLYADAQYGILYLDTLGVNRTLDTSDPNSIGGDDVGLIYFKINHPTQASDYLLDGLWTNPGLGGSIVWTADYFNGAEQTFGVAAGASFLEPGVYPILQYDPALTVCQAFGSLEVELGVNFDSGTPGATTFGSAQWILGGPTSCAWLQFDLNDDYALDCADLDVLSAAIQNGDDSFDLNFDYVIDEGDLATWLTKAGAFHNGGEIYGNVDSGYFPGDANLDSVVDVSDFAIWNSSKFTNTSTYCDGDFNVDGVVDTSDFAVWNANKFRLPNPAPNSVPEPSHSVALFVVMALLLANRRS